MLNYFIPHSDVDICFITNLNSLLGNVFFIVLFYFQDLPIKLVLL